MSFTLNLGFAGMCLFVNEDDLAAPKAIHVLLPSAAAHNAHGGADEHSHLPRLVYDVAYESSGQAATNKPRLLGLDKGSINLLTIKSTTALEPPPATVVNVTTLTGGRIVPDDMYHSTNMYPGEEVAARISFHNGTADVHADADGAFWELRGLHQLPIRVVWTMTVDDDHLDIFIQGINDAGDRPVFRLYPDAAGNMDLWIFHTPVRQLPDPQKNSLPPKTNHAKVPDPDSPATHFAAFYTLTGFEVPIFKKMPAASPAPTPITAPGPIPDPEPPPSPLMSDAERAPQMTTAAVADAADEPEHADALTGAVRAFVANSHAGYAAAAAGAGGGSEVTCTTAQALGKKLP